MAKHTYKLTYRQFVALCARHRLQPACGGGIWTAYRPYDGPYPALTIVHPVRGHALDTTVFAALAPLLA